MKTLWLVSSLALMISCGTRDSNPEFSTDSSSELAGAAANPNSNCVSTQPIPGSVLKFTCESPSILAMLDTVAMAEFRGNPEATNADAYRTMVGYQTFSSFSRHPDAHRGEADSRAAGRYQFKNATWVMLNRYISIGYAKDISWAKGRINDFSPASQDKMAIVAMHNRQVYQKLKKLKFGDSNGLKAVTAELTWEWASVPGGNTYNQGGLSFPEFQKQFWNRYKFYHAQSKLSH